MKKNNGAIKRPFSTRLAGDLQERLRNAVHHTPGATLAGLTEQFLDAGLSKMEKENGGPFRRRRGALRTGRPVAA